MPLSQCNNQHEITFCFVQFIIIYMQFTSVLDDINKGIDGFFRYRIDLNNKMFWFFFGGGIKVTVKYFENEYK